MGARPQQRRLERSERKREEPRKRSEEPERREYWERKGGFFRHYREAKKGGGLRKKAIRV